MCVCEYHPERCYKYAQLVFGRILVFQVPRRYLRQVVLGAPRALRLKRTQPLACTSTPNVYIRLSSLSSSQKYKDHSSESSNGGWSRSSSSSYPGESGGGAKSASKWEQSKQKGDLGYYFAHHITMKELAPEDYQMNGPRLLSKVTAHSVFVISPRNKRSHSCSSINSSQDQIGSQPA